MAHFRATVRGNRKEASRLGTLKSGIVATVNGWNAGIRVEAYAEERDVFRIYRTGGSNARTTPVLIATVHEGDER